MTDREFATDIVHTLQAAGHLSLFAGGCVRDELLGLSPVDFDVATAATPEQVRRLFRRTVAVGAAFGVVEVIGPKVGGTHQKVQVATFRSDGAYVDGRRPTSVTFGTPEADAARRDFTINGLFLDPLTGEVRDYVGGRADLAAKVLRAIGDPAARFGEDKLRLLRAVRMAARFGLEIEPATLAAVRAMAPQLTVVSAERIADELRKMLAHPSRPRGFGLLRDTGLLPVVLPEASGAVDGLPATAGFTTVLAALLDGVPAKAVESICRRLKLSNDETARIGWLAEHRRALAAADGLPPSVLYPLLAHPAVGELLNLHLGDGFDVSACERLLRDKSPAELDPPPLVTGDHLRAAGHVPGPGFKQALAAARAAQLDGLVTTKAEALAFAVARLG